MKVAVSPLECFVFLSSNAGFQMVGSFFTSYPVREEEKPQLIKFCTSFTSCRVSCDVICLQSSLVCGITCKLSVQRQVSDHMRKKSKLRQKFSEFDSHLPCTTVGEAGEPTPPLAGRFLLGEARGVHQNHDK